MKSGSFSSTTRALLAALTLSLGFAASGFAMPRGGDGPGFGMPELHFKAMAKMHDDLKLDARQEILWQEADKFSKEHFSSLRGRFARHREEMQSLINQPGADMRTITKRMDELKADGQKQHEAVRERWLAVYDTLNAEQKDKVRLFFKAGMERAGQHMERRQGKEHGPAGRERPDLRNPASKNQ